ncbi:LysR family transcriptional regulator [Streptomyces globisporus]|uniref:LysR family transcriptional regulator n=1 Tax=Streptomyces globisporus TaxID=1908 RepID=UPI0036FB7FDB
MELRQLEYFLAVAEEASFTKAAARVFVTQPCVSAQIRRLERELGQDLLDRSGRRVELTEVGAAVLPHVRAALSSMKEIRGAVDDVTGLVRGQVTVGSVASSLSRQLPRVVAGFSERYPSVEISLTEGSTEQLTEAVRSGRVDVAIVGVGSDPPAGLDVVMLTDEPLICAVGHEHPLAGAGTVPAEELEKHSLICLPEGSALRAAADAAWKSAGIAPRVAFEAGAPGVLVELAARGLGVAVLPEQYVRARPQTLRPVEIAGPKLRAGLGLAQRAGSRLNPAAGAFHSHARAHLG